MDAVSKAEPIEDECSSSIGSTPEPDTELYPQENAQVQKRKGGRKPVFGIPLQHLDPTSDGLWLDICHF